MVLQIVADGAFMNCEGDKTYAKEGKCPVCNMKLKKKEAKKAEKGHEGHSHG